MAGLRLAGRAGFRDDVGPEIDRRALVPQTHRQGLAAPVLDRPLAPLRSIRAPFVPIGLTVGGELRLVDRELPLGESTFRISGRQVREEELKEPGSRSSVGASDGRSSQAPRADVPAGVIAKTRRRRPSVSRVSVTRPRAPRRGGSLYRRVCGNDQKFPSVALTCCSRSYGVDGPSRASSPRTRYDVGVRRSVDIVRNVPYTSNYSVPPPTDQMPGKFTPGGRPSREL